MSTRDVSPPSADGLEDTIRAFSSVLENLEASHGKLAARAEHMEAELCCANAALATKVAELDEVKRHLEAILSSLPTGVVARAANGEITRVNEAALELLHCSADELLGRTEWPGLLGKDSLGQVHEVVRPDGTRRMIANRYSRVVLAGGEVVGSVEILDDRTALEAMTRRVHQLDKMAALGTMAGGIAHEIRNPLNAVQGFAALLASKMEPGSKEAHWVRLIGDGAVECNGIITSMLTFANPESLVLETLSASELAMEAIAAVTRDLRATGREGRYTITSDVEELAFPGDRIKLRQALRNVAANAVGAQEDGGEIHLCIAREGDSLSMRITDAGPGIPAELRDRVTDPFFTTHAGGTGLGLALVHTIARLHGGALEISPDPAALGGADVRLKIPIPPGPDSRPDSR